MTASSDYGVSIVESFAPPKMWLPGQEVNKDVYAVNTGSIAAFVKENITGKLNYTFEKKLGAWDKDCLELSDITKTSIDGVTTNEAGGFLAWTDATTTALSFDGKTAVKEGTKAGTIVKEDTIVKDENDADKTYAYKYVKDGKTYVGDNAAKDGDFYLVTNGTVNESTAEKLTLTEAEIPVALGEVASARQTETDAASRWAPTQKGTYIFRRSIDHGTNNHPDGDTFTYAGYYYVPNQVLSDPNDPNSVKVDSTTPGDGKYYKIVLGNDPYRAEVTTDPTTGRKDYKFDIYALEANLGGDATANRDGTINGTPKVWFVKELSTDEQDVTFRYEEAVTTGSEADKHNPRLVVEYGAAIANDPSTTTEHYDVIADRARKEVEYVNAKGQYDQDLANYEQAVADYTYAKKLSTAREALRDAAQKMHDADEAVNNPTNGTDKKLADAWNNLKEAANGEGASTNASLKKAIDDLNLTETKTAGVWGNTKTLSPDELLKAATGTIGASNSTKSVYEVLTADHALGNNAILPDTWKDYQHMQDIWADIQEDIADLNDALDKYTGSDMLTPEKAVEYQDIITAKLSSLSENLGLYSDAYADLLGTFVSEDVHSASRLDLDVDSTTNGVKANINAEKAKLVDANGAVKTKQDVFDEKVQEYTNAYNNDEAADGALTTATNNWDTAKEQYNKDVTAAKEEYEKAITKNADLPQPNVEVDYHDYSAGIVKDYSARRENQDSASDNAKHTGEKVYDPTLAEWSAANFSVYDADTNPSGFKADYDYYLTLVNGGIGVALPKSGNSNVKAIPAPDGAIGDVNTNTTWNEVEFADGGTIDKTIADLYAAVTASESAYKTAKSAYETAQAAADATSKITIYVNLDKDYADYWQYAGDKDQTGTEVTDKAEFYYRYILEPGETSHRLIDSVELADTVTANDYKNLTFDLDVTLDSAQITYADDQRTITTDAVDGNADAFVLKVDEADKPLAFDQAFDWVARRPTTDSIYKVSSDGTKITDMTEEDKTIAGHEYKYWFTYDSRTYVGDSDSGTFYRLNATGDDMAPSTDSNITVTVNKT